MINELLFGLRTMYLLWRIYEDGGVLRLTDISSVKTFLHLWALLTCLAFPSRFGCFWQQSTIYKRTVTDHAIHVQTWSTFQIPLRLFTSLDFKTSECLIIWYKNISRSSYSKTWQGFCFILRSNSYLYKK